MSSRYTKKKVKEAETNNWTENIESKKSLDIYRVVKEDIRKENFYYSPIGSALLFEDRAGCLRTRSFKSKHDQEDVTCAGCGKEIETIRNIVME